MSGSKKIVLGELLNICTNDQERKCLSSYNSDRSYEANMEALKANSADVLVAGAKLLRMTPLSDDGKKLYQNKGVLSDRIILRIEALFDMECGDCKETYRNPLDVEPRIRCRLCLQGCHNCEETERKVKALEELQGSGLLPSGGVWLCNACFTKNDHENLGHLKTKRKENVTAGVTESKSTDLSIIEEEGEQSAPEESDNTKRTSKISPRRGRSESADNNQQNSGLKHDHMKNICPLYLKKECPHGLRGNKEIDGHKCSLNHPPQCRKYCGFGEHPRLGCQKRRECKYYHPKLCRNSELSHKCMNINCTYVHLKRTIRPRRDQLQPTQASNLPWQSTAGQQAAPRQRNPSTSSRQDDLLPFYPGGRQQNAPKAPLNRDMRRDSAWSVAPTPYPPTIGHNKPAQRIRKDSTRSRQESSSEQSNFLEHLEDMKKGLYQKMDERFDAMISQIQDRLSRLDPPQVIAEAPQMMPPFHPQQLQQVPMQPPIHMMKSAPFQSSYF